MAFGLQWNIRLKPVKSQIACFCGKSPVCNCNGQTASNPSAATFVVIESKLLLQAVVEGFILRLMTFWMFYAVAETKC